jgi:formamidopyrimidine-DNA glycosylase
MPELPDLEVFKEYLGATSMKKKVTSVEVSSPEILNGISSRKLQSRLKGHRFITTRRHGKYLFLEVEGAGWLVLHFGMDGRLTYFKDEQKEPVHTRLKITFENGYHLALDMPRKLGGVWLVDDPDEFIAGKRLGPDPLASSFDFNEFKEAIQDKKGALKPALMDQEIISGIGNIYSDEILFQAGIHPQTKTKDLDDEALKVLYESIQKSLKTAIKHQADPGQFPNHFLITKRQEGGKCPNCDGEVEKIKVSGRTGYYCPKCQGIGG